MTAVSTAGAKTRPLHPLLVRVTHWVNAVAVTVMVGSGLEIYNAHPILPFSFPGWMTLGDWLGGALLWHFAFMWLLAGNFLVMLANGLATGRYARKLLPITPRAVLADVRAALSGRLGHDDLSIYNTVQRLLYLVALAAIAVLVLSGLAIWKPVQFQELTALFGGFDFARIVHFAAMAVIVGFAAVHVAMALLVPRSLLAMIRGR